MGIRFNEKVIADWKKYGVKSVFFLNFIKLFSVVLCFTAIIAGLYMYINVENVKKRIYQHRNNQCTEIRGTAGKVYKRRKKGCW